jgi:CheY-like chemotaxis protein/DNA-binding MarR family transcriptional regulator
VPANRLKAFIPDLPLGQSPVLVIDDDPDCLAEYAEIVGGLGYRCLTATDASCALKQIAENPQIGIVITDLDMPGMDGLTLLDELAARFTQTRPLVTIVATGAVSLDTAVQAMRSNAMDFLPKPVTQTILSAALRRASARWAQLTGQFQLLALSRLGSPQENEAQDRTSGGATPSADDLRLFIRSLVKSRHTRAKFFNPDLFAGPAWDILIDLAEAALHNHSVPTSSACAGTNAPLSTALRYVNQLVDAGLVRRQIDPVDKRRTLLELEPQALASMTRYLTASWTLHQQQDAQQG